MSSFYTKSQRSLQDKFNHRPLADNLEEDDVGSQFSDRDRDFIKSRDMFFLSTVDELGRPTSSYKGGDTGFVIVENPTTLLFPSYDGNGMYLSMGNIAENAKIGMLFIDFERPRRLRLQGVAEISFDTELLKHWAGAELAVRVQVSEVFWNCTRYVHRYKKQKPSRYIPREKQTTPIAGWKRIDEIQHVITPEEQREVEKLGTITESEWLKSVDDGSDEA